MAPSTKEVAKGQNKGRNVIIGGPYPLGFSLCAIGSVPSALSGAVGAPMPS